MKEKFDYNNIPPLKAYIDRIGAHQLNFMTFMIRIKHGNYYEEKAMIKLNRKGEIKCSSKEYAPTEEEEVAISGVFSVMAFPKHIPASTISALKPKIKNSDDHYVFYDNNRKDIIMVQERRINEDGTKSYIPWSFFDDGEWRSLEPEGKLPFWKPKKKRNMPKIAIHEGAKAAQYVDDLVNNPRKKKQLDAHPFGEELKQYEHWGIIGGALAPHRTNYKELDFEAPTDLIYICDNDSPGKSALRKFSKLYKKSIRGVLFDARWPTSWDLADEFPERFFDKEENNRYTGPSLKDLSIPATWATEKVQGEERKIHVLNSNFIDDWMHCIKPEVFIHNDEPNVMYSVSEFNNLVAPFSDIADTARLVRNDVSNKGRVLRYDPSMPSGTYSHDEGEGEKRFINTYTKGRIEKIEGDYAPFIDYMDKLFPDPKDRHEVMRWCATLIARPDIKMKYGLLVISQMQGVGKTTLGECILRPIVGTHNSSIPEQEDIVDSQFNDWKAQKRLVVANEIYAGDSYKAYNKLKGLITDSTITINRKFCVPYTIDNWVHIYACSNSLRALKLEGDDRRWLVPMVTLEKRSDAYWEKFHNWLEKKGGLGKIMYWAEEFLKENKPVSKGAHAPSTGFKKEVIEETLGTDMTLVLNAIKGITQQYGNNTVLVSDQSLVDLVRNYNYDGRRDKKILSPLVIRKLMKDNGWLELDHHTNYMPEWGIKMQLNKFMTNDKSIINLPLKAINKKNIKPLDIDNFVGI